MMKVFVSLLLAANVPSAFAELPAINFDQMVPDVKAVVAGAKESAKDEKNVADISAKYYRADRDCVNFSFDPNGSTQSDAVWLRSTEYRQECHYVGSPQYGGHQVCHDVPMWTQQEKVQVELVGRQKLFPWERETFTVCLEGRWLSIHEVQAAHKYSSVERGGLFTMTAKERKAMDPDKDGIMAELPKVVGNGITASFKDKWAAEHKGEKIAFKLALKQDLPNWFDPLIVEKEVELDVAEAYAVDFSKYASEFQGKLETGKKYYFEWGFKRLGKVSKPTFMKKGDTAGVVFAPKLQLASR